MKNLRKLSLFVLAMSIILTLTMCEKDPLKDPLTEADIMSILQDAGKVVPVADDKDEIIESSSEESGGYRYTYEKHDVVDNLESIVYLGLNDDVIWPGNMVKGDRAHDFIYEPISIDRAPVTLSISLESSSTGSSIVQTVDDPKLSTIRQGISDLLKTAVTASTKVPAKVEFSYQQVFSASQMSLFIGADISYGAGDLDTQFNWEQASSKTRIMAKYRQIYYSIDIDVPESPLEFLDPSLAKEDVAAAIGPGSRPLYVAGVSYGMMAIMVIESDYTFEQMKWALDASYSGVVKVDVELGLSSTEVMESSSIKIIVYGGSTAGLGELETGYPGFLKVVDASNEFTSDSPGVPLVYKFRHLVDNTLAQVSLTSQYTLVSPLQIQQKARVTLDKFICILADDEGSANTIDINPIWVKLDAFNRASSNDPYIQFNTAGQLLYQSSGEIAMNSGTVTKVGSSIDLVFDTENADFSLGKINLSAYARDVDSPGFPLYNDHDVASNAINILGHDIWGPHVITLKSGANFTIEAHINITKENK
jgi:hypothetical protein